MLLPPMMKEPYDDRAEDCQLSIEPSLQQIIDNAEKLGWDRTETIVAIANLAVNLLAADAETRKADLHVAEALGRVQH